MKRIALIIGLVAGCQRIESAARRDPHSHAQPDRVAVRHVALDLAVDFAAQRLSGTAKLMLTRHDRRAPLILDDEGLAIESVRDCTGAPLPHRFGTVGIGGRALSIDLVSDCVEIAYATAPEAGALLWVEPSGTAGGQHPMLFTQSQSTFARTWIPLQDTPGVRFTYEATIRPPKHMWALMSAINPQQAPADGVWRFRQARPIPSYLMALAVGDFEFRATGPRSGVYAEPSVVDAAAFEFAEVETMMTAAEQLYGAYRWARYDMLVLPPSFPFGGMENPNLTFLTPTVITGDRALVSLIAHELAHSWSGNLATNSTWNDVWLNEGFTTYVEQRIMEKLRGREHADVNWWFVGTTIAKTIAEVGLASPRTRLAHAYGAEIAADDVPTDLVYDKGSLLLRTLELAYGRERFDTFLRGWFDRHAFESVDSRTFVAEVSAELGDEVDLATWLYGTGLPAGAAPTTSTRAAALEIEAKAFEIRGVVPDATGWTTLEWSVFLRALPKALPMERIEAIDARYQLTTTRNAEIAMHWLPKVVASDARDRVGAVQNYLMTIGRRRMVVPLVTAMLRASSFWRDVAQQTFEQAKPRYHPITRRTLARMLANQQGQP
jgi:leukotriene-A4 hydrolase